MSLTPFVHVATALDGYRAGDPVVPEARAWHHLTTVLRLGVGAEVEIADGTGFGASARLADGALEVSGEVRFTPPARPTLLVAQALPKGRRFDEVLRQLTELGVDEVLPLHTTRGVTRLAGERATKAGLRWDTIVRSAGEQARLPRLPRVAPIIELQDLVPAPGPCLVAHPGGDPLPDVVAAHRGAATITLVVGPEGGFSVEELAVLRSRSALTVGLGPTVLRTEHAAAAAVAVAAAVAGRWRRGDAT